MARRKAQFTRGEYYHIYNRGCNREDIFRCDENYRFLLRILKTKVKQYNIAVIAYCLMPNHYHFLLRQDGEHTVGKRIQEVFNRYTKAFNSVYRRTGTMFEGPFKAIHIDDEEYLIHLCRYIHRNAFEAGLAQRIELWKYSNYLEWVGVRRGTLVDRTFIRNRFRTANEYREFVMEYVSPKKERREFQKYFLD